ncbi:MAG TPA: glycosyltransferase family 4 protein [Candidatus Bathyarchaeia archaeon]|nr:glycosyltransferase family 4 protein [Candidatus Bathyarchaeia archaeon]
MKVLVLAQYFSPDMGGGSARASNVVNGLLGKGCDITVVVAFPHYPHGKVPSQYKHKAIVSERIGGAKVFRVWIPALPHSSVMNRIILHLCFFVSSLFALPFVGKVDVVWCANPNLFSFFPAVVYGFVKGRPIVRNVDDLWPEDFYELGLVQSRLMRKALDFLAWLSYAVSAAITPISPGYKRRIVKKYNICAEKIHVVEVGIDKVYPLNANKQKKSRFVIMYSGILGVGYDFNIVLKAARALTKYKDIIFVIRGVGELASKLKKRIKELNLSNVVLNTDFLSKDKLSALLSSADVFILPMDSAPSTEEGLPAKVFEYQAYGKPIICISRGEPAKYVEATRSGLIVKQGDAEGFAEAVVRLYKDRKLASGFGLNGWLYVSTNMTAEKIGELMYNVLASIKP